MTKESGTRCSNCGQNGHNSRTCNDKLCLKLFGVKMLKHKKDDSMKKSFSMGNLQASGVGGEDGNAKRGYLSDGGLARSRKDGAHESKKGIPWTEEEHRTFLAGLEKLGKGDWRGISKQFVMTRTPSQVASHAQKYFLSQTTTHKKKRRSSVFDMEVKDVGHKSEAAPAMPTIQNNNLAKQNPSAPIASQIASQAMQAIPAAPIPAACNIPSFCGYPYMAGMSNTRLSYSRAKVYPQISFVPVVNYYSNGYAVQPNSYSEFAARTPMVSQSSIKKVEPPSSSTVNTDLRLSISPPQVDCSGVIRVT